MTWTTLLQKKDILGSRILGRNSPKSWLWVGKSTHCKSKLLQSSTERNFWDIWCPSEHSFLSLNSLYISKMKPSKFSILTKLSFMEVGVNKVWLWTTLDVTICTSNSWHRIKVQVLSFPLKSPYSLLAARCKRWILRFQCVRTPCTPLHTLSITQQKEVVLHLVGIAFWKSSSHNFLVSSRNCSMKSLFTYVVASHSQEFLIIDTSFQFQCESVSVLRQVWQSYNYGLLQI